MTVAELIEKLKEMPQDKEVLVPNVNDRENFAPVDFIEFDAPGTENVVIIY